MAKLRRMWANEDVRQNYEKRRLDEDVQVGKSSCVKDRKEGVVVFPAVTLDEEVDDKTCINKNRDKLIEAFCNFRNDFDDVLTELWTPSNICKI